MSEAGESSLPYVAQCRYCDQGLLRFAQCEQCGAVVALCDECELIWKDVRSVVGSQRRHADAAFPACPACDAESTQFKRLDSAEVAKSGLADCIAGESP